MDPSLAGGTTTLASAIFRSAPPSSSGGDPFKIDYKKLGIADPSGEPSGSNAKRLLWIVVGLIVAAAVYWFQYSR